MKYQCRQRLTEQDLLFPDANHCRSTLLFSLFTRFLSHRVCFFGPWPSPDPPAPPEGSLAWLPLSPFPFFPSPPPLPCFSDLFSLSLRFLSSPPAAPAAATGLYSSPVMDLYLFFRSSKVLTTSSTWSWQGLTITPCSTNPVEAAVVYSPLEP